jgi:hypothetical protein
LTAPGLSQIAGIPGDVRYFKRFGFGGSLTREPTNAMICSLQRAGKRHRLAGTFFEAVPFHRSSAIIPSGPKLMDSIRLPAGDPRSFMSAFKVLAGGIWHCIRTNFRVFFDLAQLLVQAAKSRSALAAENLSLRKQLALFQECKVRPHRRRNPIADGFLGSTVRLAQCTGDRQARYTHPRMNNILWWVNGTTPPRGKQRSNAINLALAVFTLRPFRYIKVLAVVF